MSSEHFTVDGTLIEARIRAPPSPRSRRRSKDNVLDYRPFFPRLFFLAIAAPSGVRIFS